MSEQIKRRFNVGVGKETSRGTKVAPAVWIKPTSEDYNDQVEVVATERSMGIIEDSDDQVVTKQFSSGVIAGEVFDQAFGYFLLAGIGQVSSVESGDSGVYDHTFSVLQSAQHPSLTVEVKRGDVEQKAYANVVVESLKISSEVNNYVVFEVDLRGKVGETASNSPSYSDENYFLSKHTTVKIADDYSGIGSGDELDVKNIELTISKNIEDDDLLGDSGPSDFLNKQMVIEGNLTLNFTSVYEKNYMLNGTTKAMRISLTNSDVTIGASSNPELVIDLAKVKFSESMISGGNNDIAKIDVSFKGFYSSDDAFSIKAVLTNTKSSY